MPGSSRPPPSPPVGSATDALLERVELVTFDCFGTLIDWTEAMPALGLDHERMQMFLRESERRQRPDRRDAPFVGYRALLTEVGTQLRPDLEPDDVARWARAFGDLPFFTDVRPGIALLGAVCDVGVISNCDAVHQLDVMRRLARPWDVCVVAEELEAYKPTDRAWDRAIAAVTARGYDPEHWLHVSAWHDYDLAPAAARGIRTAYVPRPRAVAPPEGSFDAGFADVLALAHAVANAKDGPYAYEVAAEVADRDVMERYVRWMEDEHLGDIRALPGVRRAELVQLDGLHARSVYRFTGRKSYERYLERDAPRLRARGRELFSEDEVRYTRTDGVVRVAT